ncbi:MAG TPA: DUF1844 domain-containing protein [Abditibacteriaceae bacterium]|nr:DUF1844 domain-containing protein [Abditibacteriaceae bacterium]
MADERDRDEEEKPRIQVVDRRMLSDDERAGKSSDEKPKLEIVGGYSAQQNPNDVPEVPNEDLEDFEDEVSEGELDPQNPGEMGEPDDEEMEPLSAEEMAQMQAEIEAAENEQFQAIEARMGRPLTEQEKNSVRDEMGRQAQAVTALEVAPLLQQFLMQMSQIAAVHMGLMPNPYTRLIARNDAQARMAIDSFGALLDVMRPQMDAASAREYDRVLNDLRVNYVQITGAQMGGGSGLGGLSSGLAGGRGGNAGRIIH